MSLIHHLTPLNLASERQRFWAADGHYNPQFVYKRVYAPAVLVKYGQPRADYYQQAVDYLTAYRPPVLQTDLEILTFEQLTDQLTRLCQRLRIPVVPLVKNTSQTSRFMLTSRGQLSVQWPARVSVEQFTQVLNHEIQTHYLRRLNEARQPWAGDRTRRNFLWKKTEEGLAIYNSKNHAHPDLQQAALMYEAVYLAQTSDFQTVYAASLARGLSRDRAFKNALRVKRGLTDTSQPGGFTKDLVYWEGYWQVSDWLAQPEHDIRDLYWGKVGLDELERLRPQAVTTGLVYPTFVTDFSGIIGS